jgi:hemerythrin
MNKQREQKENDDLIPPSIWKESMRIGVPAFDEERKLMTSVIELLDVDGNHPITNEFFLNRFGALEAAVKALYQHEEILMDKWQVPDNIRNHHLVDHTRILGMFTDVYVDSMNRAPRNALEIYRAIRSALEEHILKIADNLRNYVPSV